MSTSLGTSSASTNHFWGLSIFLYKIRKYAALASADSKGKINYELFAQDCNQPADGKNHYYVTVEVLSAYAKTWKKINNIQASQEIIPDKMNLINQSHDIFTRGTAQSFGTSDVEKIW